MNDKDRLDLFVSRAWLVFGLFLAVLVLGGLADMAGLIR